jgi:hypothetical protein
MAPADPTTKKHVIHPAVDQDDRPTVVRQPASTSGGLVPPPMEPPNCGQLQSKKSSTSGISTQFEVGASSVAWLYCSRGKLQGRLIELTDDWITIGSGTKCFINLDEHSANAVHTLIVKRDENWLLCDVGAPEGTHVNGEQLGVTVNGPYNLCDGDRITVVSTELVFKKV